MSDLENWITMAIESLRSCLHYVHGINGPVEYGPSSDMLEAIEHLRECEICADYVLQNVSPIEPECVWMCEECGEEDMDHWIYHNSNAHTLICPVHGDILAGSYTDADDDSQNEDDDDQDDDDQNNRYINETEDYEEKKSSAE